VLSLSLGCFSCCIQSYQPRTWATVLSAGDDVKWLAELLEGAFARGGERVGEFATGNLIFDVGRQLMIVAIEWQKFGLLPHGEHLGHRFFSLVLSARLTRVLMPFTILAHQKSCPFGGDPASSGVMDSSAYRIILQVSCRFCPFEKIRGNLQINPELSEAISSKKRG
jgi:hypothetical protein